MSQNCAESAHRPESLSGNASSQEPIPPWAPEFPTALCGEKKRRLQVKWRASLREGPLKVLADFFPALLMSTPASPDARFTLRRQHTLSTSRSLLFFLFFSTPCSFRCAPFSFPPPPPIFFCLFFLFFPLFSSFAPRASPVSHRVPRPLFSSPPLCESVASRARFSPLERGLRFCSVDPRFLFRLFDVFVSVAPVSAVACFRCPSRFCPAACSSSSYRLPVICIFTIGPHSFASHRGALQTARTLPPLRFPRPPPDATFFPLTALMAPLLRLRGKAPPTPAPPGNASKASHSRTEKMGGGGGGKGGREESEREVGRGGMECVRVHRSA